MQCTLWSHLPGRFETSVYVYVKERSRLEAAQAELRRLVLPTWPRTVAALSPPATYIVHFTARQHVASLVVRQPNLRQCSHYLEVIIISAHRLRKGLVKYPGPDKQQRLAATAFPYNTSRDFFQAGLGLNAGGGRRCLVRAGSDVCTTLVPVGFLHFHAHHWKKLKITFFKPALQSATVRVMLHGA